MMMLMHESVAQHPWVVSAGSPMRPLWVDVQGTRGPAGVALPPSAWHCASASQHPRKQLGSATSVFDVVNLNAIT